MTLANMKTVKNAIFVYEKIAEKEIKVGDHISNKPGCTGVSGRTS
jgi:hypothetical protein